MQVDSDFKGGTYIAGRKFTFAYITRATGGCKPGCNICGALARDRLTKFVRDTPAHLAYHQPRARQALKPGMKPSGLFMDPEKPRPRARARTVPEIPTAFLPPRKIRRQSVRHEFDFADFFQPANRVFGSSSTMGAVSSPFDLVRVLRPVADGAGGVGAFDDGAEGEGVACLFDGAFAGGVARSPPSWTNNSHSPSSPRSLRNSIAFAAPIRPA